MNILTLRDMVTEYFKTIIGGYYQWTINIQLLVYITENDGKHYINLDHVHIIHVHLQWRLSKVN